MTRESNDFTEDDGLFSNAERALKDLLKAEALLRSPNVDRVSLFRKAFRSSSVWYALTLARNLTPQDLQELFGDIVRLTTSGDPSAARELIRDMPRDWVLQHIEAAAELELQAGTYWEYRRILELFSELDPGLTQKLAKRAADSADPDIKEAGEEFLRRPNES